MIRWIVIKFLLSLPVLVIAFLALSHLFFIKNTQPIFTKIEDIPFQTYDYAIVFGVGVASTGELSDIARERVEAAIQLYQQDRVDKLFISGDNRHYYQAQTMADYAIKAGVFKDDVIVDKLGIDTHDTCRHFGKHLDIAEDAQAILVTQEFHLPRAMLMCRSEGIEVAGLTINRLGLLEERASDTYTMLATRFNRFCREAVLSWLFRLGIYDFFSIDAEKIEENNLDPQTDTLSFAPNLDY